MTSYLHEIPKERDDLVVETHALSKRFNGRLAVDNVDLHVPIAAYEAGLVRPGA